MPTVEAIVGNKIAPGLLDHYLARTGFDSQQTNEPEDPNRPDNLWKAVDEENDHGAHGSFDARASNQSPQLWTTMHRNWMVAGLFLLAASAIGGWLSSRD
jgi:hypothetical protein